MSISVSYYSGSYTYSPAYDTTEAWGSFFAIKSTFHLGQFSTQLGFKTPRDAIQTFPSSDYIILSECRIDNVSISSIVSAALNLGYVSAGDLEGTYSTNTGRIYRVFYRSIYTDAVGKGFPRIIGASYTRSIPHSASASISVTGLTASGTTVSISSSYSGRVLVSTDGTNYYYSSNTSLPVSLGTSSRTVYVAILSTSGSALGLSNGSSYSKSTLDSKINTYNTNETKNNNANSAASSFDSLYTTASNATSSSVLSGHISTLNGYLSTISSNVGSSDTRYTTRYSKMSTLNSKLTTLRNQEAEAQRNTNANNAASSFDSLYNSISSDISTATSDNLSSLQSYLNTISSNSSTADTRYTTRKTKYDTLNNKKNALDAAITAFDNLNLNTAANRTTATEAKRQLDIILTNAGSSYEGYTSRLAKYNTYVANLSTTEQLTISVGSLRKLHTNISGTMLPDKVSRYTDIHTRGTGEYNTTKTCIEKLLNRN